MVLHFSNGVITKKSGCLTEPTCLESTTLRFANRLAREELQLFLGVGPRRLRFDGYASAPRAYPNPFMTSHICDNRKFAPISVST